jgi:DNA polymerase-3 subunit epsilon
MVVKVQSWVVLALTAGALWAAEPSPGAPAAEIFFTAIDTETTGFRPESDRVVEIGAVRFRGTGEVLAATNWLIHPGMAIPFYATEVHGITDEAVAGAPSFAAVWPDVEAFCRDSVVLAHNAAFDLGFLRAELARAGVMPPPWRAVDTLPLFRRWFPQSASHALEALRRELGLPEGTQHRAAADASRLAALFCTGLKARPGVTILEVERTAGGFRGLEQGADSCR